MENLKKKLQAGQVCFGGWMQIASLSIAEIISDCNYDFCVVDLEHSEISMGDTAKIFAVLNGRSCAAAARISTNDVIAIRKPLDLGAEIIIVPLVNNKVEAELAVSFAKYPPQGIRGVAFCRANGWGSGFDKYVANANEKTMLFVMIESKSAIDNIDEILSVKGVDGVFVGPYDLSGSYGILGKTDDKVIKEALKKVVAECKKQNKFAGQHIVLPTEEKIKDAVEQGYTFLALGTDAIFVREGLDKYKEMLIKAIHPVK